MTKRKGSGIDMDEVKFAANAFIGVELGKSALEGARRVAMNGAPAERDLFAKAVAGGDDLPNMILDYIDAISESLEAAKIAGRLPTEWLMELEVHVAHVFALNLGGEEEANEEYEPPAYMATLNEILGKWTDIGLQARPAIMKKMEESVDSKTRRKLEALLN